MSFMVLNKRMTNVLAAGKVSNRPVGERSGVLLNGTESRQLTTECRSSVQRPASDVTWNQYEASHRHPRAYAYHRVFVRRSKDSGVEIGEFRPLPSRLLQASAEHLY